MLRSSLVLAAAVASALRLEPSPKVLCPDAGAVRSALSRLGVEADRRSGRAEWTVEGRRLHLRVEARTASVVEPQVRDLPLGPCDDLTEAVAFAIERATAPLGEPPPPPRRLDRADHTNRPDRPDAKRIEPTSAIAAEAEAGASREEASLDLSLHLGPAVLFSAPSFGLELGGQGFAAAEGPRLGLSLALGAAAPTTHSLQISAGQPPAEASSLGELGITRAWAAIGPSADLIGLGPYARAGAAIEGLLDVAFASPSGSLQNGHSSRDARFGGRGQVWIAARFGSIELRLAGGARALQSRTYRAIPAIPPLGVITTLPAVEGEVSAGIGLAFGGPGEERHSKSQGASP